MSEELNTEKATEGGTTTDQLLVWEEVSATIRNKYLAMALDYAYQERMVDSDRYESLSAKEKKQVEILASSTFYTEYYQDRHLTPQESKQIAKKTKIHKTVVLKKVLMTLGLLTALVGLILSFSGSTYHLGWGIIIAGVAVASLGMYYRRNDTFNLCPRCAVLGILVDRTTDRRDTNTNIDIDLDKGTVRSATTVTDTKTNHLTCPCCHRHFKTHFQQKHR